jgi:hypothetical protein
MTLEENVCVEIKEKSLSMINLSLEKMKCINMDNMRFLILVNHLFKHVPSFPRFHILINNESCISLAVESGIYAEKKIVMLFNQLVEKKYNLVQDVKNNHKHIIAIAESINQMIDLKYMLKHTELKDTSIKI